MANGSHMQSDLVGPTGIDGYFGQRIGTICVGDSPTFQYRIMGESTASPLFAVPINTLLLQGIRIWPHRQIYVADSLLGNSVCQCQISAMQHLLAALGCESGGGGPVFGEKQGTGGILVQAADGIADAV